MTLLIVQFNSFRYLTLWLQNSTYLTVEDQCKIIVVSIKPRIESKSPKKKPFFFEFPFYYFILLSPTYDFSFQNSLNATVSNVRKIVRHWVKDMLSCIGGISMVISLFQHLHVPDSEIPGIFFEKNFYFDIF